MKADPELKREGKNAARKQQNAEDVTAERANESKTRFMSTPEVVTGPINIGNPEEFSIKELASLVVELTATRSRIVHKACPTDDPRQRRPDISKARNTFVGSADAA